MRPSDLSFKGESSLPTWLATLVRELPGGGDQAPPEVLSPVTALNDLLAVTGALASGHRPPNSEDRKSLMSDVQGSFASLGTTSTTLHAPAIKNFRSLASRLDTLLDDLAGAYVLQAGAEVLLNDLFSAPSRVAALIDCVAAFHGDDFANLCQTRMRYLRTVVEASGHDWAERERRLHEALADDYAALLANGALDPPHTGEVLHIDAGGLTVQERLCLCELILAAPPPRKPVVVWLAFANAHVWPPHLEKGPVEFYDSRLWPAVVEGHWPGSPGWTQPRELSEPNASLFLDGMPEEDFVMVRVSLESVPAASARERARDLARAAIELTGWDSDWVLMDGSAAHTTLGWFGSMGFRDPRERAHQRRGNPVHHPVGAAIAHLDEELLERIADREGAALDLLADTRWRRAVAALPDAEHRVSLVVTLFERVLVPSSVGSDKWYGACKRYLEPLFMFDDVESQIWDAGHYGVWALNHRQTQRDEFLAFERAIIEHRGRFAFRVRLAAVIQLAAKLRQHLDAGSMQVRMLSEVEHRTADGAAAAAWLDDSRLRFERLLARARRQRNAITHGTRTVPDVLRTVEPFLNGLAGRLMGAVHYCVAEERDLITELESWRLLRLRKREALSTGDSSTLLID